MSKNKIKRRIKEVTAFSAALMLTAAFSLPFGTEIMGIGAGSAVVASAEEVKSGTCGISLTWSLDSDGTLTISGNDDMYNWNSTTSVPWFTVTGSIKSVVINDGVTSIGENAFNGCSSLESVTIPDSVAGIGARAFSGCSSLSSVALGDNSLLASIGVYAFYCCSKLTSIAIPNSVSSIGAYAFCCCSSLTSIAISENVTTIGYAALNNCTSLTSISVDVNNSTYSAENDVLFNKSKTSLIAYPAGKSDSSYAIPSSVDSIEANAFLECRNLTSISIPNTVDSIGVNAFCCCSGLATIAIPNSVTYIGEYAFDRCSGLESIIIPQSVTYLGDDSFCGCSALSAIFLHDSMDAASAGIPDTASQVKYTCDANGNAAIKNVTLGNGRNSLTVPEAIYGGSFTGAFAGAFSECARLRTVFLPHEADVSSAGIPVTASQIRYISDNDGNVTVTETTLGSGQLSLTIPNTIDFKPVATVFIKDGVTYITAPDTASKLSYAVDSSGNATVTELTLGIDQTTFVIPDNILGAPVTYIADEALITCPEVPHIHREKSAATCTEKAVCAICVWRYGDALGHDHSGNWQKNDTAHWKVCARNGCEEIIDKADHSFDDGVITTQPTKAEEGEKTYTCKICKHTRTEPVAKIGNTLSLPKVTATPAENSVALKWNAVDEAISYRVFYRVSGTSAWTTKNTTSTSATITDLTGGTKYDFLVLAYDGFYWSKYTNSDIINATPKTASPTAPAKPVITVTAGENSATVQWTAVSGATSYRVSGTSAWTAKNTTLTSITITGLTGGTKYDFLVRAYNGEEWSSYTDADVKTATPKAVVPPAAPVISSVTPYENSAVIRWTASNGATSYRVFYRINGTTKWSCRNTTQTAMTLWELTGGKKYDFLVRAYNGKAWSTYTDQDIKNAVPVKATPKPAITSATPAKNSVTVKWTAVDGAKSYRVFYRVKGTSKWTAVNTTRTQATVSGLTSGKTYEILVRSYSASGWSSYSPKDCAEAKVN